MGQKLWHHSPQLLASLVEEELRTGKFTYPQARKTTAVGMETSTTPAR